MRINETPPPLPQSQSPQANDRIKKTNESSKLQPPRDSVDISSNAKRLLSGQKPALPDGVSKARSESPPAGRLDTVEVGNSANRLAKALTNAGIFTDADEAHKVASKIIEKLSAVPSSQESKLERVRNRIDSGFYGSRQVAEEVAKKLLKEMSDSR